MRIFKVLLVVFCFVLNAAVVLAADKVEIKSVADDGTKVHVTVAGENLPNKFLARLTSAPGTDLSFNHYIYDDGTHGDELKNKVYTCTMLDLFGTLGPKGSQLEGTHGKVTSVTLYDTTGAVVATWKTQE